MIANATATPKAVALVLIPALVLMLAFAFSYVGAFHDPTPHAVPVAVVGPASVTAQLNRLPGDPLDARQSASRPSALSDIDDTLARLREHGAQLVDEVVRYEDVYRLCYIRGPEGLLIGLAQELS